MEDRSATRVQEEEYEHLAEPDAPCKLPLGDDELLSKKRVLGDQFNATANEIRCVRRAA